MLSPKMEHTKERVQNKTNKQKWNFPSFSLTPTPLPVQKPLPPDGTLFEPFPYSVPQAQHLGLKMSEKKVLRKY